MAPTAPVLGACSPMQQQAAPRATARACAMKSREPLSRMLVRTIPGAAYTTLSPLPRSSTRSASVSPRSARLDALYTPARARGGACMRSGVDACAWAAGRRGGIHACSKPARAPLAALRAPVNGSVTRPSALPTLMTTPLRRSSMRGTTACGVGRARVTGRAWRIHAHEGARRPRPCGPPRCPQSATRAQAARAARLAHGHGPDHVCVKHALGVVEAVVDHGAEAAHALRSATGAGRGR